jgi:hypothetical protein
MADEQHIYKDRITSNPHVMSGNRLSKGRASPLSGLWRIWPITRILMTCLWPIRN